ncbi:probable aspartic proteinase GIP2 [Macadamia integrifolia]|uniref:probable aspartic proteinase GIP2 n=1 Tax=Macadamia integrifolia TaxID=60698 RepID=UPI001C4E748B|nr:probable aspartic proteinase GIP2 [Macadamia integrifolia]
MAASFHSILLCSLFLFLISFSDAVKPKEMLLAVTKDAKTLQYVTSIKTRTPLVSVDLVVNLGGQYIWADCDSGYVSSTYHPVPCGSNRCKLAKGGSCTGCNGPRRPGCTNNTCGVVAENYPLVDSVLAAGLGEDVVAVPSTDGSNPGHLAFMRRFPITCGATFLLQGLAKGAKGMLGLARTETALHKQITSSFKIAHKFALCMPSSTTAMGVMFFGNGPYAFLPNHVDLSKSLMYTPLLINPVSTAPVYTQGEPSDEYFIGVKSIKIDGTAIPMKTSLLSFDKDGYGGTKISTMTNYTTLETSIYKALIHAFSTKAASMKIKRVASVAPFGDCFSSKNIASTRVGPAVPTIDLALQSEAVFWRIFGANSMVSVKDGVLCLGFVDGGKRPRTSIVIGGYQLEDNLLQFDLVSSKLGFSSSLLFSQTNCGNFNFTSNV